MLLIHISDVCYTKVANRHCADSLHGYPMDDTSLSTALKECSLDKECQDVNPSLIKIDVERPRKLKISYLDEKAIKK